MTSTILSFLCLFVVVPPHQLFLVLRYWGDNSDKIHMCKFYFIDDISSPQVVDKELTSRVETFNRSSRAPLTLRSCDYSYSMIAKISFDHGVITDHSNPVVYFHYRFTLTKISFQRIGYTRLFLNKYICISRGLSGWLILGYVNPCWVILCRNQFNNFGLQFYTIKNLSSQSF